MANTYTNSLTKMQSVRYYIAFRIMKAAEGYFDAVTCLSGPLSCYRKDLVLAHKEAWLHQTFLGQKATFGDDRSMTNLFSADIAQLIRIRLSVPPLSPIPTACSSGSRCAGNGPGCGNP